MLTTKAVAEHKNLLRVWLRGKGFHPSDIGFALTWYEVRSEQGEDIQDSAVLEKADAAHKAAVATIPPPEITLRVKPKTNGWSVLFGGIIGVLFVLQVEVTIWLVLLLTQSQL